MPGGNRSLTRTLVAPDGPALARVMVNVTKSPTLGRVLLTVLVSRRSACCGVSAEVALLLSGLGSNWSAWLMEAVFVCGFALTTRTVRVNIWVAPTATVPTSQVPVVGL